MLSRLPALIASILSEIHGQHLYPVLLTFAGPPISIRNCASSYTWSSYKSLQITHVVCYKVGEKSSAYHPQRLMSSLVFRPIP